MNKMKKINHVLALLAVFSVFLLGCAQPEDAVEKKSAMMEKDASAMTKEGDAMEKSAESMEKEAMMEKSPYMGKVLAGTGPTKYLEFNKADYDKALKENRKILLYFYANWCPLCRKEQPEIFAAFNELDNPGLIGFRVNYKDGDDDEFERALAKEFGIGYQHTKVILKDGQRILKAPDSWDKQRYLEELNKI